MKYRLDTPHYLYDQMLDAGTEIGDDTPYPLYDGFGPSAAMTPLDDEAKNAQNEYAKHKQNWGRTPEDQLQITVPGGDSHPFVGGGGINRPEQPIIPAPIEHVTKPNDMKPGERVKEHPIVETALQQVNDRIAQQNSERDAQEANRQADERTKQNLPKGVTVQNTGANAAPKEQASGQGPAPKSAAGQGIPGQGPGVQSPTKTDVKSTATGDTPKPPTAPSNAVPRDQAGSLTPSSESGKYEDPSKKK